MNDIRFETGKYSAEAVDYYLRRGKQMQSKEVQRLIKQGFSAAARGVAWLPAKLGTAMRNLAHHHRSGGSKSARPQST